MRSVCSLSAALADLDTGASQKILKVYRHPHYSATADNKCRKQQKVTDDAIQRNHSFSVA